mgnify:CR=1 FL=1
MWHLQELLLQFFNKQFESNVLQPFVLDVYGCNDYVKPKGRSRGFDFTTQRRSHVIRDVNQDNECFLTTMKEKAREQDDDDADDEPELKVIKEEGEDQNQDQSSVFITGTQDKVVSLKFVH